MVSLLEDIQAKLLETATRFRDQNTVEINSKEEFFIFFKEQDGFAFCHWSEDPVFEEKIKQDLGVSPRCIPFDLSYTTGRCIFTGKEDCPRVLFAKAY